MFVCFSCHVILFSMQLSVLLVILCTASIFMCACMFVCLYVESKLWQYSHVLASLNPVRYKPLPSCPHYQWVVPRPFNSSSRFLSHTRRGPSSFLEGASDIPNRNLKAHGRLFVEHVAPATETTPKYLIIAVGVVGMLCVWLLCRQRRSRLRGKRRLFGMLPTSI